MPINIPDGLPAASVLEQENIFVMSEERAVHQDIRPLKIVILNLMPTKVETEIQLMRLLSNTPLQIDITLLVPATHESKNISKEYLEKFYKTFDDIRDTNIDGIIFTGAPLEDIEFEEVDYWPELCEIFEWSKTHVTSTFHICWAAQAGVYYHYGLPKRRLPYKLFGVYPHKVHHRKEPLVRGFDDYFLIPHSRYTEVPADIIHACPDLTVLAESELAGVLLAIAKGGRQVFIFGHAEYDRYTLRDEYIRDHERGIDTALPENYFPDDDPAKEPNLQWRSHSSLLYANWINLVYQMTPYNLEDIR